VITLGALKANAFLGRISIDSDAGEEQPCIRGTRIQVCAVLDLLAERTRQKDILAKYTQRSADDIRAASASGANAAREQTIPSPGGA
jgi:uncharacterized protein (DUF433 family)